MEIMLHVDTCFSGNNRLSDTLSKPNRLFSAKHSVLGREALGPTPANRVLINHLHSPVLVVLLSCSVNRLR